MIGKRDIVEEVNELFRRTDNLDACVERDSRDIASHGHRIRDSEQIIREHTFLMGDILTNQRRLADEVQSLRLISAVCLSVAACAVVTAICAVIA